MLEEERKKRKQFQDLGRKMLGLFFHLVYPLDTGQGRGNESTVSPRTLPWRTEDGGQSRRCHPTSGHRVPPRSVRPDLCPGVRSLGPVLSSVVFLH